MKLLAFSSACLVAILFAAGSVASEKKSALDQSIRELQTAVADLSEKAQAAGKEAGKEISAELDATQKSLSEKTEATRKDLKKSSKKMSEDARQAAVHALDEITASLRRLRERLSGGSGAKKAE